MLIELTVKNMAVIKSVTISFGKGLNVLTGETGAGKSILVDAIGLLLGARSSADYVRFGSQKAEIEAIFQVNGRHPVMNVMNQLGIDAEDDGTIIVRREISLHGKSICRINGQAVTLSMLKEIGPWLIQLHGQHEHQSLLDSDRHINWLDTYGEKQINETKAEYQSLYREYQQVKSELEHLLRNEREAAHRLDLLQFQLQEIVDAKLQPGEDEELAKERRRLANSEKLFQSIESVYQSVFGEQKGLDWLGHALAHLETAAAYDENLNEPLQTIQSSYIQLEEAARSLRAYREGIEFEPERLIEIESRLDEITRLKRKYGKNVNEILEYAAEIEDELDLLQNKDNRQKKLEKRLSEISVDLALEAAELSKIRQQVALELQEAIEKELRELNMQRARFEIALKQKKDEHGIEVNGQRVKVLSTGIDEVEFLISPNPGEPLRPVAKIASGGELSRIMLAIKTILAHTERIDTLIFDEVDTGVSGRAAHSIAEKLVKVSQSSGVQVLCITHLPQVACMADSHYLISKSAADTETVTSVELLDRKGRVVELSRMLGGAELTEVTMRHAEEMIELANVTKQKIS